MAQVTESVVESAALVSLKAIGWQVKHGFRQNHGRRSRPYWNRRRSCPTNGRPHERRLTTAYSQRCLPPRLMLSVSPLIAGRSELTTARRDAGGPGTPAPRPED